MNNQSYDEKIEHLRRQLRAKIDAASHSFGEVLHVVADLLIELAQRQSAAIPEKQESKAVSEMLTTPEAAEYLGVTPKTLHVWRCTRRHDLPAVKIGKLVRYRKSDLDKFIKRRTSGGGNES
jgi:excisionase family DNA binding protein